MNKLSVTLSEKEKLLGWIYYPIQLLILPLLLSVGNILAGSPMSESVLNFVYFASNFLFVLGIFFHLLKGNSEIAIRAPLKCISCALAGLVLNWGLSYAVQILIVIVKPDFFNVNDASIGVPVQENFALTAIGTVLLVPIAEEALYRGLIFGTFYNRSRIAAYVISVSIFASVHVIGYVGMYQPLHLALCFMQYLPGAISLAWAYAKADSLWSPILMHMIINLIGVLSMR